MWPLFRTSLLRWFWWGGHNISFVRRNKNKISLNYSQYSSYLELRVKNSLLVSTEMGFFYHGRKCIVLNLHSCQKKKHPDHADVYTISTIWLPCLRPWMAYSFLWEKRICSWGSKLFSLMGDSKWQSFFSWKCIRLSLHTLFLQL